MNKRRKILFGFGASALSAPFYSLAQQQGKVWRIGVLSTRPAMGHSDESFRQGLRELGYIEGQNVTIEWRFTKGASDLLPEFASELVRLNVDCIVTTGTTATFVVNQATRTIPIVMGNSDVEPVRAGLVKNLARPGGNLTGFTSISSALAGKRLEILKATLPKMSRVAMLWDPDSRAAASQVRETRLAARKLGLQLKTHEVWEAGEIGDAFAAIVKERTQALLVATAGLMNSLQPKIPELANSARLPAMYTNTLWPLAGCLMAYGTDLPDQFRRAAAYVDKILKGAKPGELPVQQPTKFEFVVNLKAANQIGLTIPPDILARADKVIE